MHLVLVALLLLLVRLFVARAGVRPTPLPSGRRAWPLAAAAFGLALLPVLRDLPLLAGANAKVPSDMSSHLAIASEIAREGLPHGWIAKFNGGFPMALHYPPLGWLLTAGLIRIGIPPVVALKGIGLVALLLVPVLTFVAARVAGARALSAAAGAVAIAWIAPYIQFTGGWEAFFVLGLLSQALVIPIVMAWGIALLRERRLDFAPLVAAACAAAHPQVFSAAAIALVAVVVATWDRRLAWRAASSLVAGGIVAIALYGPGMASLKVPFGWPPNLSWRLHGFGPDRVLPWLVDGDLLDYEAAPVVTTAWLASALVHLSELRRPRSRAVLAASAVVLLMCMSGRWIAMDGGKLGQMLLTVAQPMRALTLVPLAAAATFVTALDVVASWLAALRLPAARLRSTSAYPLLPVVLVGLALLEIPSRASTLHAVLTEQVTPASDSCLPWIPKVDANVIRAALARAPPGRATYAGDRLPACAASAGAELDRAGPMGVTRGAGAHVGLHAIAFAQLDAPSSNVRATRAEALGVRTLVHLTRNRPEPADAWRTVDAGGDITISERVGGTDNVGAGCVREILRGPDKELFRELNVRLTANAPTMLDAPHELIALETGDAPLVSLDVPAGECDASSAVVVERPREPGAYEADVETAAPVDVVFRATAYPGWRVRSDGIELPIRRVAPGFFSVRVAPGRHHLEAVVGLPPLYAAYIVTAFLTSIALSIASSRHLMKSLHAKLRTRRM